MNKFHTFSGKMSPALRYMKRVFAFNTKLLEMAMLASRDFATVTKKLDLPPVGLDLKITDTGSGV